MYKLANNFSKEQALELLASERFARRTVSFYRYVRIPDPNAFRNSLYANFASLRCLGRIYVAREGINAQMNVPEPNWDAFLKILQSYHELHGVPLKIAVEQGESFWKLTIKVRNQIVADGLPEGTYDITNVGTHLTASEFNRLAEAPDTLIVDMRNAYESEIGHFENALLPKAATFKEELPLVKQALENHRGKKILLYCTGGIRCEKASAYLKHEGFENVYQLHGGIISYAHEIREKRLPSKFKGKNFVFDERRAERVTDDVISSCHQCASPCDSHVNCSYLPCNNLFIQCPACSEKMRGCCSEACASGVVDGARTHNPWDHNPVLHH